MRSMISRGRPGAGSMCFELAMEGKDLADVISMPFGADQAVGEVGSGTGLTRCELAMEGKDVADEVSNRFGADQVVGEVGSLSASDGDVRIIAIS